MGVVWGDECCHRSLRPAEVPLAPFVSFIASQLVWQTSLNRNIRVWRENEVYGYRRRSNNYQQRPRFARARGHGAASSGTVPVRGSSQFAGRATFY
jgi:hypothetical protein